MCGRQQVLLHVLLAGSAADGILAVQCMSVVVVFGIMVDGTLRWYVQLFHGFAAQPVCPAGCCKRHANAVAVGRVGRQLTVPAHTKHQTPAPPRVTVQFAVLEAGCGRYGMHRRVTSRNGSSGLQARAANESRCYDWATVQ